MPLARGLVCYVAFALTRVERRDTRTRAIRSGIGKLASARSYDEAVLYARQWLLGDLVAAPTWPRFSTLLVERANR